VLFVICGVCLAVSAVLWLLVSEKKAVVVAKAEVAPAIH
jgi:hypothetical protein